VFSSIVSSRVSHSPYEATCTCCCCVIRACCEYFN
jgi:hypothetical protein